MLLLHDSLGYSSTAHFLGAGYTIVAGATPQFGLAHERASATSIGLLGFQTRLVSPSTGPQASSTCVVGVLTWVSPVVYETVAFLEIGSPSGTQIRVTMEKAAEGWRLFLYRGLSSDLLLTTQFFSHSGWVFLEVKAVVGSSGSIVVRVDETEVARVEGANTHEHPSVLWDRIRLFSHTSATIRFADLYICNGLPDHGARYTTFLGKVTHSKLLLGEPSKIDWAPMPVQGLARLSILAGQSNMTGRTTATSSANWTNPNPRIRIWNRLAGVPAFQTLSSTVNSACAYLPANVPASGPEMRFAELLSAFYASSGDSASVPNHYLVKGVQDGSWLFPVTPDYCWNVSVPGGLYSRLLTDITNAVASLGGWSQIGAVDFFWLQGESDSIYTASTSTYRANLRAFLASILADIAVNGPRTTAHVIDIHPDLYPASLPDTLGFYYKHEIREIQKNILQEVKSDLDPLGADLHYRNIEISPCQISGDLTHLTEAGYDRLGDLMFDSWRSSTDYRSFVSDYEDLSDIDNQWMGTSDTGKSMFFKPLGAPDSTNNPVLAASSRSHSGATTAGGLTWTAKAVGIPLEQGFSLLSTWNLTQKQLPVIALPEHLSLEVGVFT